MYLYPVSCFSYLASDMYWYSIGYVYTKRVRVYMYSPKVMIYAHLYPNFDIRDGGDQHLQFRTHLATTRGPFSVGMSLRARNQMIDISRINQGRMNLRQIGDTH